MKKLFKSCLSIVLAFTIIFSSAIVVLTEVDFSALFEVKANAASVDGLNFALNDDGESYSVTDCNESASGELIIPATYNGLPVTSIGEGAFYWCDSLISVTIPDSVTSIGGAAFRGCDGLTSVTIPNSVMSIGSCAFYWCDSLTSVTIGDGVTSIGEDAFKNCKSLTSVNITDIGKWCNISFSNSYSNPLYYAKKIYMNGVLATDVNIPDNITSIGDFAFFWCDSLISVTIPDSVTSIGDYAFHDCDSLTLLTIGDDVTSIGDEAFCGCDSLTLLTIGDGVTSIGAHAFANCYSLTTITIPDGVTSIGNGAFYNCTSLTSITVPDSVTSIGDDAFSWCTSLTSITIPDSVTSIGDDAFYNCTSLTTITIPDSVTIIGTNAFRECDSLTSVTIPDSVTSIGDYTFYDCDSLTSITIHDSVTSIGDHAFANCYSLTSITIPDSVTSIGGYAFWGCNSLTSVTIPDGATSIGDEAFRNCDSLTSVTIPDSVTSIGYWAFYDCTSLTSITIGDGVKSVGNCAFSRCDSLMSIDVDSANLYYTSVDGVLFNKNKTKLIQYPIGKNATSYTIPGSVTSISGNAFDNCDNLTSITIPGSVTSIGDHAFANCYSLTSITIPDSVTSIGVGAFWGCNSLTSVTIPDSVTSIGGYAFYNCDSLTSITIPGSVTSIDYEAFYDCDSLTSVTIPDSVTSIGAWALGYGHSHKINGFTIYGTKGSAAETYANENKFTFIEKTDECTHSSTKWIIDKEATVYVAGTKHKECAQCGEVLETAVIPQLKPATPKLSSVANTASGVKVTWGAVEGADDYIVYRRTYNAKTKKWSGWSKLADGATGTNYVDTTAKSGTYYIYTAKANNEAGYGGHTSGLKTYFLATPKVTSTANTNNAITIKWGKVAGATGYYVYRKTTGGWTRIGETTGTSFTDKTAKAGVTYRYTVRAYYGSYLSSFVAKGYAVRRLTTPSLKSVTSAKSGVTFKWNKVTGATGYIVYRKTGNGSWQRLATVKTNSYLDKTAKKGVTYKYTVRAYYGTSTSYYNTKGLTIKDKY